jgi:TrkA domain protein
VNEGQPAGLDILEVALPGIGRRFTLPAADGGRVVVVIHHSGRRDLYVFPPGAPDDQFPVASISLTDDQARRLGAVLGGAYFKPAVVADVETVIGNLLIDWVTVRADSPATDHSIAELEIRRRGPRPRPRDRLNALLGFGPRGTEPEVDDERDL